MLLTLHLIAWKIRNRGGQYEDEWRLGHTAQWEHYEDIPDIYKEDIKNVLLLASNNKWLGGDQPHQYDKWTKKEKSDFAFIIFIALRAVEMHRILKDTGSLYWQCDAKMSHYIRIVLDAIFGHANLVNEIIWSYSAPGNYPKSFVKSHQTLFLYAKFIGMHTFNKFQEKSYLSHEYGFTNADILQDAKGYYRMAFERDVFKIQPKRKELIKDYPTQKPIELYRKIIKASSGEGDIVLDPFCGCTTTCVAAEIEGRQWLGIDINPQVEQNIIQKIRKVLPELQEERDIRINLFNPSIYHFVKEEALENELGKDKINYIVGKSGEIRLKSAKDKKEWIYKTLAGDWTNDEQQILQDGSVIYKCRGYRLKGTNYSCGKWLNADLFQCDRVIPEQGYVINNVQPLCQSCNASKSDQVWLLSQQITYGIINENVIQQVLICRHVIYCLFLNPDTYL